MAVVIIDSMRLQMKFIFAVLNFLGERHLPHYALSFQTGEKKVQEK
jgi:hypothetical protein